jgi:cation transport ATPase
MSPDFHFHEPPNPGTNFRPAVLGFLNPLLAAFIHVTSELAFILNSTRLLPSRAR